MDNTEYISNHLQCDEADKIAVCDIVRRIYRYTLLTRMYGLLALEEEIQREENLFLRDCLSRVVNSMDPESLREYMGIRILADHVTGMPFLEMMVIADGVLQIQRMENPHTILARLSAWFGSAFQEQYAAETAALDRQIDTLVQEYAGREQKSRPCSLCPEFDALTGYNDSILQRVLREVTPDDLALALKAAGYSVYLRVVSSLSEERRHRLTEDIGALRHVRNCDAERAQKQIVAIVARLEALGEILI